MAPALTKVLKDGHGTHLSSPASSELDPLLMFTEDSDLQKLSLFGSLDFCIPLSPLDLPASSVLSPCLQASVSQYEMMPSLSPSSLLSFLPFNKDLSESHQGASVLPGVTDMLLGLLPEHSSQEHGLQHGYGDAPACGPDGFDVLQSSVTHASLFPECSPGETTSQGNPHAFANVPTVTKEREAGMGFFPTAEQRCNSRLNTDPLASSAAQEDSLKAQLSRQAGLHSRAWRLQKRLQTVLAEHSLLHCSQQLEGLKRHSRLEDVSLDSLDSIYPGLLPQEASSKPSSSYLELSTDPSSVTELKEFSCSSQTLVRSLLESLDSDATASSSSDEELEEHKKCRKTRRTSPVGRSYERQWLEERAYLGSRWSWLQLRLAKVEGRIQQLVELHNHIRSSKGGVVLAAPQPPTHRKLQQSLAGGTRGLSCSATDENEPCSPARLLHNIERQSAQLTQIVNSLMPPLGFSPLSKQAQAWREQGSFDSGQNAAHNAAMPGGSKRRKLWSRGLFKADASCVCARTRPLVAHHKPRLFTFSTPSPQASWQSISSSSSSFLPSSDTCCSSCDPVVLCSNPADCPSWTLLSRNPCSGSPCVLPFSFDMASSYHIQRSRAREEWSQRPSFINNQSPALSHYNRCSSTPVHSSHKYKQHAEHHKSKVLGLSPIRIGSKQRKRKRKPILQHIEDGMDSLYQWCDLQESSDDLLEESYTESLLKQASQGFVRKRQGESVYNINNVVIPMSVARVEKLQYKDILTPSWRMFDSSSLAQGRAHKIEDHEEEQQEENLSDEVFAQRHLALEQKEKLRWSFWGKRKCCRRPTRSGSRFPGSGSTMCTSGEESSVEWSSAQLDSDEQPSSEEWLPQAPWELRAFPLHEKEEEALLSPTLEWSESDNTITCDAVAPSPGVRPPPGEQSWCITSNGS